MAEFKNILLPVDLSGISRKIAPYVSMMVAQHQAKLHVLYVQDTLEGYSGLAIPHVDLSALASDLAKAAKESLDKMVAETFPDMDGVDTSVALGSPAREIKAYADKHGMDLIIMASHARKGIEYAFFGSVARKLARDSDVPVLLINPSKV